MLKWRRIISLIIARLDRVFVKTLKWRRVVAASSVHNAKPEARSEIALRWQAFERAGKGSFGKRSFRRERNWSRALIPFPFPFERLPRRLGQKISAIVSKIFKLIVFQIDHISLTSADSYRCDSFYSSSFPSLRGRL